jgi:diacylglycerol kinase (ATP)
VGVKRVFAAVADHHDDEDDESNSLEDEDESEDGRKKFGAVAIFKIPDEVDISHLS